MFERIRSRSAAHDGLQPDKRYIVFLGEQQYGPIIENDTLIVGQGDFLRRHGRAICKNPQDQQALHSSASSSGARRTPTVMLSSRKTLPATSCSCSAVASLSCFGTSNRFS